MLQQALYSGEEHSRRGGETEFLVEKIEPRPACVAVAELQPLEGWIRAGAVGPLVVTLDAGIDHHDLRAAARFRYLLVYELVVEGIADNYNYLRPARCLVEMRVERFVRVLLEPRPLNPAGIARTVQYSFPNDISCACPG